MSRHKWELLRSPTNGGLFNLQRVLGIWPPELVFSITTETDRLTSSSQITGLRVGWRSTTTSEANSRMRQGPRDSIHLCMPSDARLETMTTMDSKILR